MQFDKICQTLSKFDSAFKSPDCPCNNFNGREEWIEEIKTLIPEFIDLTFKPIQFNTYNHLKYVLKQTRANINKREYEVYVKRKREINKEPCTYEEYMDSDSDSDSDFDFDYEPDDFYK